MSGDRYYILPGNRICSQHHFTDNNGRESEFFEWCLLPFHYKKIVQLTFKKPG